MSILGGTLIQAKDTIHTKWFELQASKRSSPECAFLQKSLYDDILNLGKEALSELERGHPESKYITRLESVLNEIEWKSNVADETRIEGEVYYVMTPERGRDAITLDINRLANEVHLAGMSLLQAQAQYCGCNISPLVDLRSINTGVLRYCEGTLSLGRKRGWVHAPGATVEHKPGAVERHANTVKFEPTERGYDLDIEYVESGDSNWRLRQGGVVDFIVKKDGRCGDLGELMVKCDIKDASEDDILDLALLVSQLKDIDLLNRECIPMAFELAHEQATELKGLEPREELWDVNWTRASEFDAVRDCEGGEYSEDGEADRERRIRRAELERRCTAAIEADESEINYAIEKAQNDPCTLKPYSRLDDVNYIEGILAACQQIKRETNGPWAWCMDLAKERKEDLKHAAKDLVERCPPEGIILGLEAMGYIGKYPMTQVAYICELAENQDCLDILKQVDIRWAAGIKAAELPLYGGSDSNGN